MVSLFGITSNSCQQIKNTIPWPSNLQSLQRESRKYTQKNQSSSSYGFIQGRGFIFFPFVYVPSPFGCLQFPSFNRNFQSQHSEESQCWVHEKLNQFGSSILSRCYLCCGAVLHKRISRNPICMRTFAQFGVFRCFIKRVAPGVFFLALFPLLCFPSWTLSSWEIWFRLNFTDLYVNCNCEECSQCFIFSEYKFMFYRGNI